jgi:hypothetical protein
VARRYRGGVKFVLVAEGICRMPSEADNECDVAGGLIDLRSKSMYPESGIFNRWVVLADRGGAWRVAFIFLGRHRLNVHLKSAE